jgi:hypothetical protein
MIPMSVGTSIPSLRRKKSFGNIDGEKHEAIWTHRATMDVGRRLEKRDSVASLLSKKSASLGMYLAIDERESRPTRKEMGTTWGKKRKGVNFRWSS